MNFTFNGSSEEKLQDMIHEITREDQRARNNGAILEQMIQLAKENLDTRLEVDTAESEICIFDKRSRTRAHHYEEQVGDLQRPSGCFVCFLWLTTSS